MAFTSVRETQVVEISQVNGEINQAGLSTPQPLLYCESFAQSEVYSMCC